MKYLYQSLSVTILSLAIFSNAFATTGGPTFVYDFSYNPADESVYYVKSDHCGRGCPPELFKMSLNSGVSSIAYSCDEAEKAPNYGSGVIQTMTDGFKRLIPINLKKNNIEIDVSYVSSETFPGEENPWRRTFSARVFQNGVKVDEFQLMGCSLEQPFLFEGYALPAFNKKLILLSSTKGDCFEGGYVREIPQLVRVENILNKNYSTLYYKQNSALVPTEATLVVYENQKVEVKPDSQKREDAKKVRLINDVDGFGKPSVLVRFIKSLINFSHSFF